MNQPVLKKVRVFVSLAFFLAMGLMFLDVVVSMPAAASRFALYFQLVPSLLAFVTLGSLSACGFIVVIGLTLLSGRVYCSFLCPLGVLQDLLIYGRRKIRRQRFRPAAPHPLVRTGFLVMVLAPFVGGSIIGLTLLDPFSNFGRIFTHLFRPVAMALNNALVFAMARFDLFIIDPVAFKGLAIFPLVFSLAFCVALVWLSMKHGRLYCNTVCPVGTMLGFLSKCALLKIRLLPDRCTGCRACERVCKSSCIDVKNQAIDFSRCVACCNCIQACREAAVGFHLKPGKNAPNSLQDADKRQFMLQTAAVLLAAGTGTGAVPKQIRVYKSSTVPVVRKSAVFPPGALSLDHFMTRCTACHRCVAACPTQVLQPALLEYGLAGIMKPSMDYKAGFCSYDCVLCSTVCPSGAIVRQALPVKKRIQLGNAEFIKKNCIVYSQGTDCGACAEHCPTKAVRMVLDETIHRRAPKIDKNICVGCGACEFACPTQPYKSIYVQGHPVHTVAEKPKEEKIEEKVDLKQAFPF